MKNLFKSLMLVAVAAMAFTACTTEQIEINAVAKKTIIKMSALLNDDTRSGFLTPEEGSVVYKSEWHEGDQIIVAETGNLNNNTTVAIATNGDFTAVLDGELGFIDVYSPASAWTLNETAEATLPTEQTPLANSVDPKAHILKRSAAPVSGGSVKLSHEFAYGKISVATPEGFVIDRVEVLFEGSFNGTAREQELTLYANNVENNEFWFATQYMTVETFTVTAYDADDKAYTKTVNVSESSNTLVFDYNKVKSFGVANLTEVTDEPEVPVFTYASVYRSYSANDKQLQFTNDDYNLIIDLGGDSVYKDNTIILGTYKSGEWPGIDKGYSAFNSKDLESIEMEVSASNGLYDIVFRNISGLAGDIPEIRYKGEIEGLNNPDSRTKLDTPSVSGIVSGNSATVSWQEITGAANYTVTLNGTETKTVETAYITYQGLEWETTYTVSVVANPADTAVNTASDAGTATFTTEADPNAGGNEDGGNTSGENFEDWTFSASLDMGSLLLTLTDGTHTVTMTLNQLAGGTFYLNGDGVLNAINIKVNGVAAESASGTMEMSSSSNYYIVLDCYINGAHYTGLSSNPVV